MSERFQPMISIVVPCYNEAANIGPLYERLRAALDGESANWELIAVDDHSKDETFAVLERLSQRDGRIRVIRLARNVGSHIAVTCGLDHSQGDCAVVISADLQDPPEIIREMLERWRDGDQIVWAAREDFKGRKPIGGFFSKFYHKLMASILKDSNLPPDGADVFLLDRVAIDALSQFGERNLSLFAIVAWLGFRQGTIWYKKEMRQRGKSGWTLRKKLKLFVDSVTAFSYFPIRLMSVIGICISLLGCLYALIVIINYIMNVPTEGWTSLMVVVLVLGGFQMAMLGVLGEYIWRSLDESRRRPRYNIERIIGPKEKDLRAAHSD